MSTKHEAAGSNPAAITNQADATRRFAASLSPEQRRSHYGRKHSSETKAKTARSLKKYFEAPETRAAQASAAKASWLDKTKHATRRPRKRVCTGCLQEFAPVRRISKGYSTTCSDECFMTVKRKNARGDRGAVYNGVTFDSRWEVEIARWLDEHKIPWTRPAPIPWTDGSGRAHKYFPDFLLTKCGVYLDPKNRLVVAAQREKLDAVSKKIKLIYGDVATIKAEVARFVCR